MYQYICPTCGRASYSATDPAHAYSDICPYEGCDGHLVATLEYRGVTAYIAYSEADALWYGTARYKGDLITFDADDEGLIGLEAEFRKAVDGYFEFCVEIGKG